jgi:hypothetical protein
MLSSSILCKNKEVLARNGGGRNWERNVSKPVFYARVTFEHDTLLLALCLGWKITLLSLFRTRKGYMKKEPPWSSL